MPKPQYAHGARKHTVVIRPRTLTTSAQPTLQPACTKPPLQKPEPPKAFSNQSLADFQTAQHIREQYGVRGMLTLDVKPPHEIRLQFCPEIWEMPREFIKAMAKLQVPTFIRNTPIEHIPYTLKWIDTAIGQHLVAIWKKSQPHSIEKEFLARVISLLHFPEVHEPITQEPPPTCEMEASQRWNQENHPIFQMVEAYN